jgi:uncharacterized protein (DUF4415 family)
MSRKLILPTAAENREIMAGIAADPDNPEWTAADFANARPASEVLPGLFGAKNAAELLRPKKPGRPITDTPKVFTGIRLDADVLEAFRATGKGWQTRMNDALKQWLQEHQPGGLR